MNVITSIPSLTNFKRENISHNAILKRYALLFDNVIFNRSGIPVGQGGMIDTLGQLISMLVNPYGTIEERTKLGKNKNFSSIFMDCWDVVEDHQKFESMRFQILDDTTQKRISEFSYSEIRKINNLPVDSLKFDIDDVKEISGDLHSDIGLTLLAISEGIDIIPSYSPIISKALIDESFNLGGKCYEIFQNNLLVPDFDAFSWDEILDLRDDKYIVSFRNTINELLNEKVGVDSALTDKIQQDLWALAEDAKPNIGKTFLGAVGSNIPSPIGINPIGVGMALKDIYNARERENKYGHVFFVQNLRKLKS